MAARMGYIEEPRVALWLFASPAASVIWLVARMWLGYEWLKAGWEKVFGAGNAAWMHGGAAVKGFATGAIQASKAPDHPQVAYGWWVSFLHYVRDNSAWIAKLVAVGEVVIGVALLLGLFTGIFAFLGVVLNFSYVFSGVAGVNPAFIVVGLFLVLAWRNAGWLGADRVVLSALGTPWHPGKLLDRHAAEQPEGNGRQRTKRPPVAV